MSQKCVYLNAALANLKTLNSIRSDNRQIIHDIKEETVARKTISNKSIYLWICLFSVRIISVGTISAFKLHLEFVHLLFKHWGVFRLFELFISFETVTADDVLNLEASTKHATFSIFFYFSCCASTSCNSWIIKALQLSCLVSFHPLQLFLKCFSLVLPRLKERLNYKVIAR